MKGEAKGSMLKGTSACFWRRSKEVIWPQIGSARIQRWVEDVTSDHELTPDRTSTIGDNLSSKLRVDARTTQSGAVMGRQPFMSAPCQLLGARCASRGLSPFMSAVRLGCRSHIKTKTPSPSNSLSFLFDLPNDGKYPKYGVSRLTKPILTHIVSCHGNSCQHERTR